MVGGGGSDVGKSGKRKKGEHKKRPLSRRGAVIHSSEGLPSDPAEVCDSAVWQYHSHGWKSRIAEEVRARPLEWLAEHRSLKISIHAR